MTARAATAIRWYNSLIVRVVALCVILLLCLFGSIYVLTRHYFHQVVTEMEERTAEIASSVTFRLEMNPDDLEPITQELRNLYEDVQIHLEPVLKEEAPRVIPKAGNGYVMVATNTVSVGGKQYRLTAEFSLTPQTEILRAFRNKYMIALSLGFLIALGLLVYFIMETLRPLSELAESCAGVGAGELRSVEIRKNYGEILALEQTFNRMVNSLREKEKVEANLRQAQRLSALGNLAAGIAHDIRNPLNSIKLLSSHALDNLTGGEPEATSRQLNAIKCEVDRVEDILSGFLSLAKERELTPEPTHVDALLNECLRLVRQDAEARQVRLVSELRCGENMLPLDPKHFRRAVINVLLNALEACPPEGRVRLFSRMSDADCEIEIRDDGPGMDKQVMERVFEPYFTTKSAGTGLGLAITRGIIEEHGGRISVSSEPGQGTQVLISLPLGEHAR